MQKIQAILRGSGYLLNPELFAQTAIQDLDDRILATTDKKGHGLYVVDCLKRNKPVKVTPEEVIRQLFLAKLLDHYRYEKRRIEVEYPVQMGSSASKRADIVVMDAKRPDAPYLIVELKQLKGKEGKEQLKSYCNATGAPLGVWSNGQDVSFFLRKDPNIFDEIRDIPTATERIQDVLNERFTILDLMLTDRLKSKSLRRIIEEFEDEVLANAGVDVFEEAFKLIFTKLFDESKSSRDKDKLNLWLETNPGRTIKELHESADAADVAFRNGFRNLEFRNTGHEADTKRQVDDLFAEAREKWKGIFPKDDRIKLLPSHLQTCVSYLESVKLFNSNLEVVDDAFEYLVNKDAKGDKGQYFTPRYVIDMCVKMLNPQPHEYMIDTAAGSCGFPVHTIFHVWQQLTPGKKNLFSTDERTDEQRDYVREKVFALDFDEKTVRVGRTLNLIAGDGETNVLQINSLDYDRWESDFYDNKEWRRVYGQGFDNLTELRAGKRDDLRRFRFDVLMANPPFAGDIKDARLIRRYEMGKKLVEKIEERRDRKTGQIIQHKTTQEKGWQEKISRDLLFVERNLDMLRPGGRMAIVLPQGRFNNATDRLLRQYVARQCRILAVVGLHPNTFKPHTGTKTSVLLVQKWNDDAEAGPLCPKVDDYNIFFATQQKEGKNNSGEKLYWKLGDIEEAEPILDLAEANDTPGEEQPTPRFRTPPQHAPTPRAEEALLDEHGHAIVWHDLYSTATNRADFPHTPEGIAEAFLEFAAKEKLSFF